MKKTKLKKVIASVAICGLTVLTGYFSIMAVTHTPTILGQKTYAGGHVYIDSEGDDFGITELTENFFGPYGYGDEANDILIPGSKREGNIKVKNYSDTNQFNVFMFAKSTDVQGTPGDDNYSNPYEDYRNANSGSYYSADKLKAASDELVNRYLDLEIYDENGSPVYIGKLNGKGDGTVDPPYLMDVENAIYMGKLKPGEEVEYTFKLSVPAYEVMSVARPGSNEARLGLDHGYDKTVAMIDWVFVLSYVLPEAVSTSQDESQKPTPVSPGTGEAPNLYIYAAAACGFSALAIFFVTFGGRRRRKEDD